LATGLPTERIEHAGAEGGPGGQTNIAIEELEVVVLNQMRREVESQLRGQKSEIIDATVNTGEQPRLGPAPDPQ
jgi:hypothetical protein